MLQIMGHYVEKRGSSVMGINRVLIQVQHIFQIKGCEEYVTNQHLLCNPLLDKTE
jgi:hypothetical protein